MKNDWKSAIFSQMTLGMVTGLDFRLSAGNHEMDGNSLQSIKCASPDQIDIVQYLMACNAIKGEIQTPAILPSGKHRFGGIVWIDTVNPAALNAAVEQLKGPLQRDLKTIRPWIEEQTQQHWDLNPASLTTRLATMPRMNGHGTVHSRAIVDDLDTRDILKIDWRPNNMVAIIGSTPKFAREVARDFVPKPSLSFLDQGDPRTHGPLDIFPGEAITPRWRSWAGPQP